MNSERNADPRSCIRSPSRRNFLRLAGLGAAAFAAPLTLSGCRTLSRAGSNTLDFHDDFGVLNYAFTLESLEAQYYDRVVNNPPADLRPGDLEVLRDIRDNEVIHERFFRRALGPFKIDPPEVDFSKFDFGSRESVLNTARMFEDTGVAAYNGAGKRLKLAEFLTIAGKIVSVEARQAAAIRDLLDPGSRAFAGDDVVDERGFDQAFEPGEVLAKVQIYFKTPPRVVGL